MSVSQNYYPKACFAQQMRNGGMLFSFLLASQFLLGQYQIGVIPRVSPDRAIYQKIGFTEIEIKYGSPSVNDREIWGELVPYDKVWRAGANSATTVSFSDAVSIEGNRLDSGRYALFVIPKENEAWEVIFNKKYKQWGAFRYNPAEDVVRIQVVPKQMDTKSERLTYEIYNSGFKACSIYLLWDFMRLEIPIETHYLSQFIEEINARASTQPDYIKWIPFIQGAEHLHEILEKVDTAFAWVNRAEGIMNTTSEWNDQFYPRDYVQGHLYWTKAKVLAWKGEYPKAIEACEEMKSLLPASFYEKNNEKLGMDKMVKQWQQESK